MKRPDLLFVLNDLPFFLSHRLPVARALVDLGLEVAVAAPPDRDGQRRLEDEGIGFHPWPVDRKGARPVAELRCLWRLASLYRRLRPRMLHHVTPKPVLYGSIAARLIAPRPLINAISGMGFAFVAGDESRRGMRLLSTTLMRFASAGERTHLIFQNPDNLTWFLRRRLLPPRRATLIFGSGVDLEAFRPAPEPEGIFTILLPARMLYDKGVAETVEAVAALRAEGRDVDLVLAGATDPGNPRAIPESVLRGWEREGKARWIGHHADMPGLLRSAHVVCMPSYYGEGIPKSLIEGAAAGRPLVSADTPGCRHVVQHGYNGLLVAPRDSEQLAGALASLIDNPSLRRRLGERGRRLAERFFAVGEVVRRHLDLYRRVRR